MKSEARARLAPLLSPSSIAVIGASPNAGNGHNALRNLMEIGYEGEIYAVSPKYEQVLGVPCFASLAKLPRVPDAIYVGIDAERAIDELRVAGSLGVRAAVVHAGGFAETGDLGRRLQLALTAAASETGMVVCGPNTLGIINVHGRAALYGASMPRELHPGAIGAVFQSGSVLLALMNAGRNLRFSHLISSGNEAVLDITDYFDFLLDDSRTRLIVGFVEAIRQPKRFLEVASRAAEMRKPIILLKPGRTEAGRHAALAHTGALAGSDEVIDAVFRKYGVIRAHDLDELIELAVLFAGVPRYPERGDVAVTCVSGGEMAIVLDSADDEKVPLVALQAGTVNGLRERLPSHVRPANPLDMTATGLYEPELYRQALVTLASDPGCGLVAVSQDFPGGMGDVQSKRYQDTARAFVAAAAAIDKPLVVFSNLSGAIDPDAGAILAAGKVPVLLGTRESLKAIGHLIRFARREGGMRRSATPESLTGSSTEWQKTTKEVRQLLHLATGPLSEHGSKSVLARFGIRPVKDVLATDEAGAAAAAEAIGYPIVLKIASPDIPHKTEAGGVRLGLADARSVIAAREEIISNALKFAPGAKIDGVSVQEQVFGGIEVIVGCARDEQFGPVILFGLGGVFVEVLKDVALALAPIDHDEAQVLIRSVRAFALLDGARGRPRGDITALADALVSLSKMAVALGDDFQAIDINPLLVLPEGRGVVAADALVIPACR